jgi:hypothetical protein
VSVVAREVDFYETIRDAAWHCGYRMHHQRSTHNGTPIMGDAGFPDFVLVLPAAPGRRGVVRFVEIKLDGGKGLTPAQREWQAELIEAGARADVVWVPSGLDAFLAELVQESRLR